MGLNNTDRLGLVFLILFSLLSLLNSIPGSVDAYKNYTVGDSLGWYDNIEKPNVDYQKWASTKNFSLGDFLRMDPAPGEGMRPPMPNSPESPIPLVLPGHCCIENKEGGWQLGNHCSSVLI